MWDEEGWEGLGDGDFGIPATRSCSVDELFLGMPSIHSEILTLGFTDPSCTDMLLFPTEDILLIKSCVLPITS